jgi:large subunit ribosomal protein L4
MKYPVYNISGEQVKEIELPSRLFGVAAKTSVIHQVVVAQEANSRQALAHTKTRAEVRGGGKKPWRQKGTGRARHGSTRSPIWVGGGITFGPRSDRNFSQKVNKKQKQAALAMCLSDKATDKKLVIFDKLSEGVKKTKALNQWISEIKSKVPAISKSKKVLLVMGEKDAGLILAAKNLAGVSTISAHSMNCVDLLRAQAILTTEKAIDKIEKQFKLVKEKKS